MTNQSCKRQSDRQLSLWQLNGGQPEKDQNEQQCRNSELPHPFSHPDVDHFSAQDVKKYL